VSSVSTGTGLSSSYFDLARRNEQDSIKPQLKHPHWLLDQQAWTVVIGADVFRDPGRPWKKPTTQETLCLIPHVGASCLTFLMACIGKCKYYNPCATTGCVRQATLSGKYCRAYYCKNSKGNLAGPSSKLAHVLESHGHAHTRSIVPYVLDKRYYYTAKEKRGNKVQATCDTGSYTWHHSI